MQKKKRPVIYSLGRLLSRQFNPTATGIDRLDIRYAKWLLDESRSGRTVIFIRQVRNVMYRINDTSAERLINDLWRKWVNNKSVEISTLKLKIFNEIFWIKCRIRDYIGPYIDPEIVEALKNKGKPVYLNSSHSGVQHTEVHQLLRDKTAADLIFYLHDIIPIDFPEYFSPKGDLIHRGRVEVIARLGSLTLVNSTHTADRFTNYCQANNLPVPRTELLKIGVEDHILEASKEPLSPLPTSISEKIGTAPFFIMIGTIEPRKNHLLILHVWRDMANDYDARGELCPKLVIVGQRGWENENIIDLLERCPQVKKHVIELNGLGDSEMIGLTRHARALLMPSFEEGWGMPLAEALTLGTPAICSDLPALRECGQHLGTYLHPLDGPSWIQALTKFASLDARVLNYKPDDWQAHLHHLESKIDKKL